MPPNFITYDWWPNKPGVTYNAMINPLIPFNIAGAIWYQGESNTINYESYRKLMATLIETGEVISGRSSLFIMFR